MYIIIDLSHGFDYVEIVKDADGNPVLFDTEDDAEIYAEEIGIGIPKIVELWI